MRILLAFLAASLLAACTDRKDERAHCIEMALEMPPLSEGVAVFDDMNGHVAEARSRGTLRNGRSPMVMASLTKPLVAQEIRRRVARGEFELTQSLGDFHVFSGLSQATTRVTIQQLLQHRGGFDRGSGDPLFATGSSSCHSAARLVLSRNTDFLPGTATIYSNAGYCVLGEILLESDRSTPMDASLEVALNSQLGAAGGWVGSLRDLHAALKQGFPLVELDSSPALPDGSHYAYGWRSWPTSSTHARWTHFGRLPGIVSIALTDGRRDLLVAHFLGDPADVEGVSAQVGQELWRCIVASRQ